MNIVEGYAIIYGFIFCGVLLQNLRFPYSDKYFAACVHYSLCWPVLLYLSYLGQNYFSLQYYDYKLHIKTLKLKRKTRKNKKTKKLKGINNDVD